MPGSYTINTLQYDPDKCTGCGMCWSVCPHNVFTSNHRIARLINPEACIECGACQINCPADAIKVDSGVGCAAAMILTALKGKKEVTCGCC
jgi:NAD-dependent dihydropyrimidine dehydrogenase PreA subunit